jgi:succinate dehydrogenase hydrophobic membrane anchor protein
MTEKPYRMAGFNWLLQRITAVILAAGLFTHFLVLHFTLDKPLTIEKVRARLSSPCWIIFDVILLACCLYHALNGAYGIIADYSPSGGTRKFFLWSLWFAGILAFVFGVLILAPLSG